ncbi:hypothetical protein B0T19DRAFT_4534 [Cercophora scortea]|uniref:LysM domain-containing protein n=1 Tax=Cercophora scortea TaxID=314031 RepID=A0AAE0MJW3_9PEZI|nr:hypothetical protein B0T19DRAFT_4534 [Cercophora scortea]
MQNRSQRVANADFNAADAFKSTYQLISFINKNVRSGHRHEFSMVNLSKAVLELGTWCLVLTQAVLAQQFNGSRFQYDRGGYMKLSEQCSSALNTTVACSEHLRDKTFWDRSDVPVSRERYLTETCHDACRDSLIDLRAKIQRACDGEREFIHHNGMAYPATYMVDRYLYAFDVMCYRNKHTSKLCDLTLLQWGKDGLSPPAHVRNCHDCTLGPLQVQLSSPFGYTKDRASTFASATSSCHATAYPYTTPEPYGTRLPQAPPTYAYNIIRPGPRCRGRYVIQEGDTCESIAASLQVSSHILRHINGLSMRCKRNSFENYRDGSFIRAGEKLCIPDKCLTHQIVEDDTCATVASQYGITIPEFKAWNPALNAPCDVLGTREPLLVCISAPGPLPFEIAPPVEEEQLPGWIRQPWEQILENIKDSIEDRKAQGHDLPPPPRPKPEWKLAREEGRPDPDIIVAPGTSSETCGGWHRYVDVEGSDLELLKKYWDSSIWRNTCSGVAKRYGLSLDKLLDWNRSLEDMGDEDCVLRPGYKYCIRDGPEFDSSTLRLIRSPSPYERDKLEHGPPQMDEMTCKFSLFGMEV